MAAKQFRHLSSDQLRTAIRSRIKYLEQVIAEKEKALVNAPKGYLKGSIHANETTFQYCWRKNYTTDKWKYIRKSEISRAAKLAQRTYDEKILLEAKKELRVLKEVDALSGGGRASVEELYFALPESFQRLIKPVEEPLNQFYRKWRSIQYTPKTFSEEDHSNFRTLLGERVRSKSEKDIANTLTLNNIPYFYEKPIVLKGYGTVWPDLTLLDFVNRREVYWEHEGLMDDRDYRDSAVRKTACYQKNGFYQGRQLIITQETSRTPLDSDLLETLVGQLSNCRLPQGIEDERIKKVKER